MSKDIAKLFNEKFDLNLTVGKISGTRRRHNIACKFTHLSNSKDGTFKKGVDSWNKGRTGYMGANKTSFKKGCVPPNRSPLGEERLTREGYVEIKVTDGEKNDNWKYKHRHIWEQHNGEIEEGSTIIFRDGDRENLDIDNLISVTRSQLLYLNQHKADKGQDGMIDTLLSMEKLKRTIADKQGYETVDMKDKQGIYGIFKGSKLIASGSLGQLKASQNLKTRTLQMYGSKYRRINQSKARYLKKIGDGKSE